MVRIALYQPDIPQNTGTILRFAACLGIPVDIIRPAGFDLSDRALRRAGMDYLTLADLTRHESWQAFLTAQHSESDGRLLALTTHGETRLDEFQFQNSDILLFGRETAGLPDEVRQHAHAQLKIPLRPNTRSLNLAMAVAVVASEALRQLEAYPR